MRGDPGIIEVLNEVLTAELTAVSQYFLDARMCDNWGYGRLGQRFREESIDEMKDADRLIERILYLEGMPNLQRLGAIRVGEGPAEKLTLALELEREAIDRLNRAVTRCVEAGDNGSRELVASILAGEEEHADWLEAQLHAIGQIGVEHYLAQQLNA